MPVILAIDSATDACSVALLDAKKSISEKQHTVPRDHTQQLLPMIADLLSTHSLTVLDLDAIAFSAGPGSFTGLRICLSVAQGLAYGADLPLVAVSTLETMAVGVQRLQPVVESNVIVPVIDARMNEVYWCAYTVEEQGVVQPLFQEKVGSPEDCQQDIQQYIDKGVITVGSGCHYAELQSPRLIRSDTAFYPSAYDVARRGAELFSQGQTIDPQSAQPTYLRNEINWQKRQRIRMS